VGGADNREHAATPATQFTAPKRRPFPYRTPAFRRFSEDQAPIGAAFGEQSFVRALLDDMAALEHQDAVDGADRRGPGRRRRQYPDRGVGDRAGRFGNGQCQQPDSLGRGQIASSIAAPGKGGDVDVIVSSDILLPDRGPQIAAQSTGSVGAGSITVPAARLLMNNGAAISTEAATSSATAAVPPGSGAVGRRLGSRLL